MSYIVARLLVQVELIIIKCPIEANWQVYDLPKAVFSTLSIVNDIWISLKGSEP